MRTSYTAFYAKGDNEETGRTKETPETERRHADQQPY